MPELCKQNDVTSRQAQVDVSCLLLLFSIFYHTVFRCENLHFDRYLPVFYIDQKCIYGALAVAVKDEMVCFCTPITSAYFTPINCS